MDVDRYITGDVVEAVAYFLYVDPNAENRDEATDALRFVLPGILATYRDDLGPIVNGIVAQAQREARAGALREAAKRFAAGYPAIWDCRDISEHLLRMADEAVAE